ncbi:hypothetical protein [Actinoplanes sp. RD1]|uniref:hypothetical protein n=1 Tax=Actinoplanes sp. RD1 TaxID=3064538 RepID=UPI0027417BCC|nr:hypothetical protein [Actinoplanes sp. RD1]
MTHLDERAAADLLGPLATEPPGPSLVDVPETMRAGARRRRNRRLAAGAGAFAAVLLAGSALVLLPHPVQRKATVPAVSRSAAPVPRLPSDCAVTRLPTGDVAKAVVHAVDPSGRYVTGRTYPEGRAFGTYPVTVWRDGKLLTTIDFPGSDQSLDAVNSSGDAVGSSFTDEVQFPYVWHDGKLTRLKGGAGSASAISDAGVIVGVLGSRPARWASWDAEPSLLPLPPGTTQGAAVDVDEDGTVLGMAGPPIGPEANDTAYVWLPGGDVRKLPLPPEAGFFHAVGLRNGLVVGSAGFEDDDALTFAGYQYDIASNRMEELPAAAQSPAAVAANGWIVTDGGGRSPAVVVGGDTIGLEHYRPSAGGLTFGEGKPGDEYQIRGISDDGRTIAGSFNPAVGLVNEPLVWRCRLQ